MEEFVSHMEQRSNFVALRIAATMPRKEEFVIDIAQKVSMQTIPQRFNQKMLMSFLLPLFLSSQSIIYEDEEELNSWIWKSLVVFQCILRKNATGDNAGCLK